MCDGTGKQYKLRSQWYRTPSLLHKIFPGVSYRCWCCGQDTGTFLYIWLSCPLISPFWELVHKHIVDVATLPLDFSPAQYLLHHTSLPLSTYNKSLAMHMVLATCLCIPVLWKSSRPPSMREWFHRINCTREMEELIHMARETLHKFYKTWATWLHFADSDSYKSVMS